MIINAFFLNPRKTIVVCAEPKIEFAACCGKRSINLNGRPHKPVAYDQTIKLRNLIIFIVYKAT